MKKNRGRRQRLKKGLATAVILLLLPYVVTIFLNGPSVESGMDVSGPYIKVQTASGEVRMSIDTYGMGVLAREIAMDHEPEAIQAQAVAVRTGLYKKASEEGEQVVFQEQFYTESDMKKQWGTSHYLDYYKKLQTAWEKTDGQIVTYQGNPATTPYHRLSNGSTRIGKEVFGTEDYPYLAKKDCPKDVEAKDQMSTEVIEKQEHEITKNDSAGYVLGIRFGEKTYTGEEFRKEFGLASSCFTLQEYKGKIRVTTKGVGHGLGMSQYAANEMAKEGKTHEEILQYFFEGTEIKEVAEILSNIE